MAKLDYIVYWVGDHYYIVWVTRTEAKRIRSDPTKTISTWLLY